MSKNCTTCGHNGSVNSAFCFFCKDVGKDNEVLMSHWKSDGASDEDQSDNVIDSNPTEWQPISNAPEDDRLVAIKGYCVKSLKRYYAICRYTKCDLYGESGYLELGNETNGVIGPETIHSFIELPE